MHLKNHLALPSEIQEIELPYFKQRGLQLFVKREDLIHPQISGNKWRKLKYNLEYIQRNNLPGFITFGGAYSNHIYACAALAKLKGIPSVGIIRGDELLPENETLRFAVEYGMHLYFVQRSSYRAKEHSEEVQAIISKYPGNMLIPEGGSNEKSLKGVHEMMDEVAEYRVQFDYVCVSAGTGATAAGILQRMQQLDYPAELIVNSSLKGDWMESEILKYSELTHSNRLRVLIDYHFGGYAKSDESLRAFMINFVQQTNIPIDHVYNGKLLFAVFDLIKKDFFPPDSKILWIHTGGLR